VQWRPGAERQWERIEKNLISEIPDLASLSPEDTHSWLSAIHPGAVITLS
jgi:hypothetical protein